MVADRHNLCYYNMSEICMCFDDYADGQFRPICVRHRGMFGYALRLLHDRQVNANLATDNHSDSQIAMVHVLMMKL